MLTLSIENGYGKKMTPPTTPNTPASKRHILWSCGFVLSCLCAPLAFAANEPAEDVKQDKAAQEASAPAQANTQTSNESSTEGSTEDNVDNNTENNTKPTEAPPRAVPSGHRLQQNALINQLSQQGRQHEIVPIGRDETAFTGFLLNETTGKPQGALLILHDAQQHQHWPTTTAPVREQLPNHGWMTLSIELERPPKHYAQLIGEPFVVKSNAEKPEDSTDQASTQEQSTKAESDEDGAATDDNRLVDKLNTQNDQTAQDTTQKPQDNHSQPNTSDVKTPNFATQQKAYRQETALRIEQAMAFLAERGQFNIVILAYGHSSAHAVSHLSKENQKAKIDKGLALIMVDAQLPNTPMNEAQIDTVSALIKLDIPILDIVTQDVETFVSSNQTPSTQRRGRMQHAKRERYQQRRLVVGANATQHPKRITRLIRGWLKTHASGSQISVGAPPST